MANDLQTRQNSEQLAAIPQRDEKCDAIMRGCLSASYREFGTLMMFNMPTPEERRALAARQAVLVDTFKHEKNKIRVLIGEMLEGYRNRGVRPNESSTTVIDLYLRELGLEPKTPTWAVWRACGAIRLWSDPARLEAAGIRNYEAPTTMSMRRLCDSYVWDVRAELSNIGSVLQGKQVRPETPPAERARIAGEFRALADDMKARLAEDRLAGPPPLSEAQLVELAGGEESFAAIPDAKSYGVPKTVVELTAGLIKP